MKLTKKIVALTLAVLMAASLCTGLASCKKDDGKYTVGIIQLIQHEALDAATQGFKDVLIAEFGEENITFVEGNAQGDSEKCTTIANDLVNKKVDLILGNATAALQAAYNATETIPVLGTSITDYGTALNMKFNGGAIGGNVSGTTDLAPLDQQAAMITELFPSAQKVGILYCSAEPNSEYQAIEIRKELIKLGLTEANIKDFTFSDSNDVSSASNLAAAFADVIYIPTDNTAAAFGETINASIGNVPVIAGESGICSKCGVATLSIDYYELGKITGEMAVQILKGEAEVGKMAVASVPANTIKKQYNATKWEALNLGAAPAGYTAIQ